LVEPPQNKPLTKQIHTQKSTKCIETGFNPNGHPMKGTGKVVRVGEGPPKSTRGSKSKVGFVAVRNTRKQAMNQTNSYPTINQMHKNRLEPS
jgi:hypothetical protein